MRKHYFRYLILTLTITSFFQIPNFLFAQQFGPGAGPGPVAGVAQTTLTTFETADFSGSGICAMCHSGLTDEATPTPNDVSNDAHWRSTMMANAAKDPLWQAKISTEVQLVDNPILKQAIQEKCSRCHMGMARYQQLADGATKDDIYVLDTGFLDPTHDLHEAAMDGVSCTLCHQVQPDGLGDPSTYTGQYFIDTDTLPPNREIFGPYQNPFGNSMQQASGFNPKIGDQIEDPAHCGSCHTLYTPVLDAGGNQVLDPDTGEYAEFPEQTTYLEWEHSGFAKTCQGCHLPEAVGSVVISNRPRRLPARTPFYQHHFVGGNSFMVGLLRDNADVLGVTADPGHLKDTIDRTQALLAGQTAELTVTPERAGNLLTVTVDVVNSAGHKLPSGLPSRRVWLHLVVTDASQKTIFESGRPLTGGRIEGNDAENPGNTSLSYEPHYDTIKSADQVQIYEPIMYTYEGTTGGYDEVTYTLLRAYSYKKDNRLLPAGFDKGDVHEDIAVYGLAQEDGNFIGGSDEVTYEIDVTGASGALDITVRLLYQTLSKPFVDDLENTNTELVDSFMGMYSQTANDPVVLASVQPPVE